MKNKLLILIIVLLLESCSSECNEYVEMIRNQAYHGTILKKYLHKNRDTPYIVLRKANGRIETVFIDYLIYDRVDSADYIVKQYGTLKHVVYRNDSEREIGRA